MKRLERSALNCSVQICFPIWASERAASTAETERTASSKMATTCTIRIAFPFTCSIDSQWVVWATAPGNKTTRKLLYADIILLRLKRGGVLKREGEQTLVSKPFKMEQGNGALSGGSLSLGIEPDHTNQQLNETSLRRYSTQRFPSLFPFIVGCSPANRKQAREEEKPSPQKRRRVQGK